MANLRSIYVIPVFIFYVIHISEALYEDQIGKFDWKRSFIGKVKYASFEGRRIIVATEENVLASLDIKNGQIAWRHILENPKEQNIQLLHVDKTIITVSGGLNSWFIRSWDLISGILLYEWTLFSERPVHSEWLVWKGQLVHVVPVLGSHIDIAFYQLQTGENRNKTTRIPAPWIRDLSHCVLSNTYYICLSSDDSTGLMYGVDVVAETKLEPKSIGELIGESPGVVQVVNFEYKKPALLLLRNNVAKLIIFEQDSVRVTPYNLLSNAIAIQTEDAHKIYQLDINTKNTDKILKVITKDLESGNTESTIDAEYPLGLGAPYIIAGSCRSSSCDLLLSSTDNALLLVHLPEGKILWTKEEALSNIVAAEFFELPVSELDASIENEFKTVSDDVISMFCHRLSTQAKQLSSLLFSGQLMSNTGLVRDEFGLHKIIVVATSVGKLFGIDTITGSIVWSYRLPNVKPFKAFDSDVILLFGQRTARYAPLPAQCLLVAEDSNTGEGILFQFDPITGLPSQAIQKLGYQLKQAMLLPYENEDHLKPVMILTSNDEIHVYPSSAKDILKPHVKSIYMYTVDAEKSLMTGYGVTKDLAKVLPVWEVNLKPTKLVAISTRRPTERLHSQGRVLPDRSVYYKYVNPNLIAIATLNEDPIHKHVLSVYLIDGVSGLILYATSHKRAKGPIHIIHSENWLVYSYFSERFRRTEIAAAELYEGEIQSNSTSFSSYAVSQLPRVLSQSYILPVTPQTMTVTLTERGITNKFILAALTNGAITEIPWMILQPRIPDITCGPEDACIPYMPEIPIMPEANINYNQTLSRTKGIQVAPARLESTSHVLVYGLDLFYTRVAPSKTFDVLKEDFDHKLIVLVLTGLIIASYVTKHLASRKALRQAWK